MASRTVIQPIIVSGWNLSRYAKVPFRSAVKFHVICASRKTGEFGSAPSSVESLL